MGMISIYTAVEDRLSAAVLERLVEETDGKLGIGVAIPPKGSGDLKKKLPELIHLAPHIPVVLLTDLDRKECAPSLIGEWLGQQAKPDKLLFRVAVREVEAWLLADKHNFARFAHIPPSKLPESPEDLNDPKQTLLNLVARHSPSSLKQDIVADHGHGPRQGLAYNERLSQFVYSCWDPEEASMRADSLARTRLRIGKLACQ
ncbi:DUF4276 family protein [Billgrantia kenyensis]|uniref:DUF4276 family protein n=1 Tax=Billgrantia kenyensis TaxID=321266 RepID=A0A7V9W130_9GAMM|nr:DUF4276 family protein [Halomonas kenyensis]MBA2779101.1 DUF4276 family protein [Halomonas kenyensis]MCG6660528.1 DUF4276 family protein [Halomonas kenyensis]